MSALTMTNVSIAYHHIPVIQHCDFSLEQGEIGALLGASGSGKSTLLKAIAGLLPIVSGSIVLQGKTVSSAEYHMPPQARDVGMLFQDYALFPHLNALENVCFGLKHLPKEEARAKALSALERVQLASFAQRFPHELSGGQQQRVALARALVRDPRLLLLDEPFSNLDQAVREHLIQDLRQLFHEQGISALLVTHNKHEAFALADKVALMEEGKMIFVASPKALYDDSAMAEGDLANFLGHVVRVAGVKRGNWIQTALGNFPTRDSDKALSDGEPLLYALRPHQYDLRRNDEKGREVVSVQFLGDVSLYTLDMGDDEKLTLMSTKRFACGERLEVVV